MAKLTLAALAGLNNPTTAVTTINNNNALIEAALEKTLSRDGTSPNMMEATLDMNSNRIINLPEPSSAQEPATKSYVDTAWEWEGPWDAMVEYEVHDFVERDGSSYICIVPHTSASNSAPGSGVDWEDYWNLVAARGAEGNQDSIDLSGYYTAAETNLLLNDKADTVHAHVIADTTGLQAALDGKAATIHTHTASQVTDFDTEVSNNTDVAANTSARHAHANKALLDTYTQTEANLASAVANNHTHSNKAILDATTASFLTADETKLDGIEAGAEVNNISDANATDLTDGGDTTLHIHDTRYYTETEIDSKIREKLTAARTYYVRTDGSDSNTGLIDSAGGAFLTLQKAFDVICSLDFTGYTITVQIRDGTYTGGLNINKGWLGGQITFQGNSGTPSNVHINVTGNAFTVSTPLTNLFLIKDMKISATASCIRNANPGILQFNNVVFGAALAHVETAGPGAQINAAGNYTIDGDATFHLLGVAGFSQVAGRTITLSGTRAITWFVYASRMAQVQIFANTYSGSFTGTRYYAEGNSVLFANGEATTTIPGTIAGATSTGAQYI